METVSPPEERRCERCGRVEQWDDETGTWVATGTGEERRYGTPHCVHEWNITGTYNPIETE
jgi:hypothetical protein